MRLIDADEMQLNEQEAYMKAQPKCDDLTAKVNQVVHMKIQQLIHDTPTAYDVDKVMEELKEARFPITDLKQGVKINGMQQTDDAVLYSKAQEIVKAGEVNE